MLKILTLLFIVSSCSNYIDITDCPACPIDNKSPFPSKVALYLYNQCGHSLSVKDIPGSKPDIKYIGRSKNSSKEACDALGEYQDTYGEW